MVVSLGEKTTPNYTWKSCAVDIARLLLFLYTQTRHSIDLVELFDFVSFGFARSLRRLRTFESIETCIYALNSNFVPTNMETKGYNFILCWYLRKLFCEKEEEASVRHTHFKTKSSMISKWLFLNRRCLKLVYNSIQFNGWKNIPINSWAHRQLIRIQKSPLIWPSNCEWILSVMNCLIFFWFTFERLKYRFPNAKCSKHSMFQKSFDGIPLISTVKIEWNFNQNLRFSFKIRVIKSSSQSVGCKIEVFKRV